MINSEINELGFVYDGDVKWPKEEYQELHYPSVKAKARAFYKSVANEKIEIGFTEKVQNEQYSHNLVEGVVPEYIADGDMEIWTY